MILQIRQYKSVFLVFGLKKEDLNGRPIPQSVNFCGSVPEIRGFYRNAQFLMKIAVFDKMYGFWSESVKSRSISSK